MTQSVSQRPMRFDLHERLVNIKRDINYLHLQEEDHSFAPRLFQCSNASGTFRVEELQDFDQEVSTPLWLLRNFGQHDSQISK